MKHCFHLDPFSEFGSRIFLIHWYECDLGLQLWIMCLDPEMLLNSVFFRKGRKDAGERKRRLLKECRE